MSNLPRPLDSAYRGPPRRPPVVVGRGPAAGSSGSLAGLIGGIAGPLLCLGCLASLALIGLFATMIGAAAYMNNIQNQIYRRFVNSGNMIELNIMVLFCALFFSIYVLTKHRRGVAVSS